MAKLAGKYIGRGGDGGSDMYGTFQVLPDDYLPLEVEESAKFVDPYTEMQAAVYAHIASNPGRDVHMDELVEVGSKMDRNDVRNLVFGAAIALRNLELVEFNRSTLIARMRGKAAS